MCLIILILLLKLRLYKQTTCRFLIKINQLKYTDELIMLLSKIVPPNILLGGIEIIIRLAKETIMYV